jgi:hypothetical protein
MCYNTHYTKQTGAIQMAKFTVEAQETVFYTFYVEADSIEEAQRLAEAGEYDTGDPIDGDHFTVTDIHPA